MEKMLGKPLHIPCKIDEVNMNEGVLKIIKTIRPHWKSDYLQQKLLTDGKTNKLVQIEYSGKGEEEIMLIRVYGNKTDLLIDRSAETRNIIILNKFDLAPCLYATFDNGLAYDFIPGKTLSEETVTSPKVFKLVAKRLAKVHKIRLPNGTDKSPSLWSKIDQFYNLVPDVFSDIKKQKRYSQLIPPKSELKKEIEYLKTFLTNLNCSVVFAHNDLLLGNVIYNEKLNSVSFIDFEYSSYNYQAFDIGNHFVEFAGINDVDYTKYPKKDLQIDWIRTYLQEYKETNEISIEEIEKLYVEVNKFSLTAHIFWALWALIQAEHSFIDYDFIEYGAIRLKEYFTRKEEFLAL